MMQKLIYGTDTGSIEDYGQCVVVLVPDELFEDYDELEAILGDPDRWDSVATQTIVTWEDMREAFDLAMRAEGIDVTTRECVLATVKDAVDNND